MAYERAYIQKLKQILVDHRAWLANPSTGRCADLSFYDLAELSMPKLNLKRAKLTGVGFARSKLVEANLEMADLFSADLEGANLTKANLYGADLRGACLNDTILAGANLVGCDLRTGSVLEMDEDEKQSRMEKRRFHRAVDAFSPVTEMIDADLTGALMMSSRLNNCDFTGADLSGSDLAGADLSNAVLVGATLNDVNLKDVNASGAILAGAILNDSTQEQLEELGASGPQTFRNIERDFETLIEQHKLFVASGGEAGERLDMDMVAMPDADFQEVNFSAVRLRRSNLRNVNFRGARLLMSDFSYCDLRGVNFQDAEVSGCIFRGANLEGADFNNARIQVVKINGDPNRPWPTNFTRAFMRGTDLRTGQVDGAVFRSTDLTQSRLSLTLLRNSDLRTAKLPDGMTQEKIAYLKSRDPDAEVLA